jgi:beta-lactamase regulating signal transducer with metallopeptidase domain
VEFLANWLVQGSIAVIAAAVLLRLLHRARAHARYWVCMVGFALVLALPLMSKVVAFVPQEDESAAIGAAPLPLVSLPHTPALHTALFALWCVWVGVNSVWLVTAMVKIVRTRRRVRTFPSAVEQRLSHWRRVKGRRRTTRLVLSDDISAAAVIGGGLPVIAVAPTLVEHLTNDELDRVVVHEWAHVQRRDDVANVVQLIVRLLVGWHPAVWWFDQRLQAEREAACDEIAVRMTGSSKGYAACLLKLASLPLTRRHTAPALGVLSSRTLSARIQRIVAHEYQGSSTWSRTVASAGIIVLVGVCCGIGSLRIVGAAIVSAELEVAQVMSTPPPPQRESPPVASLESKPTPRDARKSSRRTLATPSANVRTAVVATSEPLADAPARAVVANALPDSPDVEPIEPSPRQWQRDELLPARSIQIPTEQGVTPWAAAASAGITLGERSKKGGVGTAAAFTRFGKRLADAF